MTNTVTNMINICDDLYANGVTPKLIKLPTRKPRKGEATMSRVGGSKTAWRPSIRLGHASRHLKAGQTHQ